VLFGGHIDSWDVGVGAMDDGGGIMITRQVYSILSNYDKKAVRAFKVKYFFKRLLNNSIYSQILTTVKALGLKPRRTMRLVMFTGEVSKEIKSIKDMLDIT
jgi:carboxypeptidase Q